MVNSNNEKKLKIEKVSFANLFSLEDYIEYEFISKLRREGYNVKVRNSDSSYTKYLDYRRQGLTNDEIQKLIGVETTTLIYKVVSEEIFIQTRSGVRLTG